MNTTLVGERWDDEYRHGRYELDPPLPFVQEILTTLQAHGEIWHEVGLYVGCGNGRNYLPLIDAGANLHGLDISEKAIQGLAERRPANELLARTRDEFDLVTEPKQDVIRRSPPKIGSWAQWEVIWKRRA